MHPASLDMTLKHISQRNINANPPDTVTASPVSIAQLGNVTEQPSTHLSSGTGLFANISVSIGDAALQMITPSPSVSTKLKVTPPKHDKADPAYTLKKFAMPSLITGGMTSVVGEIYTTGATSLALKDMVAPHTTVVQGTIRNSLFGNITTYDQISTHYQSGVRVQMTDELSVTSAMSELSFVGGARGSMLGLARFYSGFEGTRLDTLNVDAGASIDWREVRLWDSGKRSSNQVQAIAAMLALGQGAGQLLGAAVGANVLAPALGASVGGYISGALTSRAISFFTPPDRLVNKPLSGSSLNLRLPQISFTGRTHFLGSRFIEASAKIGVRTLTEMCLPQNLIDEQSSTNIATKQIVTNEIAAKQPATASLASRRATPLRFNDEQSVLRQRRITLD